MKKPTFLTVTAGDGGGSAGSKGKFTQNAKKNKINSGGKKIVKRKSQK